MVSVDLIKLRDKQPRHYFDEQKLEKLSGSIKEFGILQPILVRPLDNGEYELLAGSRHLRAAINAGQTSVPIVVKEFSDKQARNYYIAKYLIKHNKIIIISINKVDLYWKLQSINNRVNIISTNRMVTVRRG